MDRTRPTARSVTIPEPLESDNADVRDALATAGAMWSSGDRGEALRWLRRAAELATDLGDDNRALSLFKAQSLLGSLRPPPPADAARSTSAAAPSPAAPVPAPPAASGAAPAPVATGAQTETAALSSAPPAALVRVEAHGIPLSDVFLRGQLPLGVRLRIASDVLKQVHDEGGGVLVPRVAASRMRLNQVLIGGDGIARLAPGGGTSGTATLLWEILAGDASPSEPPPQLGEVAVDVPQPILAVVARAQSPGADFTRVKHLLAAFDALIAPHAADAEAVIEATGAESEARAVEARQSQSRLSLDLSIDPVLQQLPAPELQARAPRAPETAPTDEEATPPSSRPPQPEAAVKSPTAPRASAAPGGASSPRPPAAFARSSGSAPAPPGKSAGAPRPPRPWQGVSGRPGLTPQPPPHQGPRPPMPRPSGGPLPPPKAPSRPPPRPHQLPPPPSIDPSAIPVDPIPPPPPFGTTPLAQTTTPAPLAPTPSAGVFGPTPTPSPLAPTPTPGPFVQTPTPAPPRMPSARPPMDTLTGPFDEAARKRKVALIAIAVAAGILLLIGLIGALS